NLLLFAILTFFPTIRNLNATEKPNPCNIWAKAKKLKGLPNFHIVNNNLYRGAQPTVKGFKLLEKMGVKTIINLRSLHSDRSKIKNTNLKYFHINMKAWHPEEENIIKFLKLIKNKNNLPIFVHCKHGADRTGLMIAMYRIIFCHWTKDQAINEMTKGGFGFHKVWDNIIMFIKNADINKINAAIN
ncbi:MAG: dual specificity protein phosphatase family protein, partial [Spirochaetota bacterium]|nr:dual specificity protein phosphatase family protein [Spirochaetota bacterium]